MVGKFKAIIPGKFNEKAFWDEYDNLVHEVGFAMYDDFEDTTEGWKDPPIFIVKFPTNRSASIVEITTDDLIYTFVTKGTRPHRIEPKNAPALVFLPGFVAKTKPGSIKSGGGHRGTPPPIVSQGVDHPGSKPRDFDVIIQKKWLPIFAQRAEQATAAAVQKSNHAIT